MRFDQAFKVTQADELAEKESKLLQGNSDTSGAGILPVNAVQKKSFPVQESKRQTDPKLKMGGKQCFRCGSPQHLADKCSHAESYCGKPGHLAKACFKKKKDFGGNNITHQVTATPTSGTCTKEEQENSVPSCTVYMKSVQSSGNSSITPPLYKLTVTIQDQEFPMEVDTGNSVTLLDSTDFTKIGGQVTTLRSPTVLLKSYTGDIIHIAYDAILRARHATTSNEDFRIFSPLSVLQSGQCHNKH